MAKKVLNTVLAAVIFSAWIAAFFVIPAYVTRMMFVHGEWVAKLLVYFVVLLALGKAVTDNKVHLQFYLWIKRRFGIKIY